MPTCVQNGNSNLTQTCIGSERSSLFWTLPRSTPHITTKTGLPTDTRVEVIGFFCNVWMAFEWLKISSRTYPRIIAREMQDLTSPCAEFIFWLHYFSRDNKSNFGKYTGRLIDVCYPDSIMPCTAIRCSFKTPSAFLPQPAKLLQVRHSQILADKLSSRQWIKSESKTFFSAPKHVGTQMSCRCY